MSSRTLWELPAVASDHVPSLPGRSVQVLHALSALCAGRSRSRARASPDLQEVSVRTEPVATLVTLWPAPPMEVIFQVWHEPATRVSIRTCLPLPLVVLQPATPRVRVWSVAPPEQDLTDRLEPELLVRRTCRRRHPEIGARVPALSGPDQVAPGDGAIVV